MKPTHLLLVPPLLLLVALVACSGDAGAPSLAGAPVVDVARPLVGVVDPGADPAVVLLEADGRDPCSGALLAADVVLTARRCVSMTEGDLGCPASGPQVTGAIDLTTLRVLVGTDAATATERARGRAVLVPEGDVLCGADIALVLLDATIDDVAPLVVQPTGAAVGDHVRSVAFSGGQEQVRDHVPVLEASSRELELVEGPCVATAGGPAIDETSGQVVGLVSRSGPSCDAGAAGYDVDTRTDAFQELIAQALAEGSTVHETDQAKEKKGPIDLGASCTGGAGCSAGACVRYQGSEYCTRTCDPTDKCPSDYKCMGAQSGVTVCVEE
jgi:Trypsin